MKILQLCLRFPYPPADGGTIAMYNMAHALDKAGAEVKILSFNTRKHFIDPATVPEDFTGKFKPEMVYLDASVKLLPSFLNLFENGSYNVSRFDLKLFHDTLEQLLDKEKFDVIQMESLFMTPYIETIRKKSKALIVLRSHNVEFVIWKRLAGAGQSFIKKWYLDFLSQRLEKYERQVVNHLDGIIALTDEDKKLFIELGATIPVKVSPIGINVGDYPFNVNNEPLSIVHLGSMDWLPNIEGVDWFLEKVYPLLVQGGIHAKIYLAGKSMPARIYKLANDQLRVDGKIDDARQYLSGKQIMIVPLLSGGGMRVKIIEGLAMGKTIISTTTGAEGIKYENGKNIIIADTPGEFFDAIKGLLQDPGLAYRIGKEGRLLAEKVYDNQVIGSGILEFYESLGDKKVLTRPSSQGSL